MIPSNLCFPCSLTLGNESFIDQIKRHVCLLLLKTPKVLPTLKMTELLGEEDIDTQNSHGLTYMPCLFRK